MSKEHAKIDPAVKQRWVTALRASRYKQGKGALRQLLGGTHAYCCLGVLCNVLDHRKWKAHTAPGPTTNPLTPRPADVFDWGELNAYVNTPFLGLSQTVVEHLIEMNDDDDCTFGQIADWIEENL